MLELATKQERLEPTITALLLRKLSTLGSTVGMPREQER